MAHPRSGDSSAIVATWLRLPQPELGQAVLLLRQTCRQAGRELPRDALADRLAALSDRPVGVDGTAVYRWETGRADPSRMYRQLLGRACEVELGHMNEPARREFIRQLALLVGWPLLAAHLGTAAAAPPASALPIAGWPPNEPAGQDFVMSMHDTVRHLVGLDNSYGGNEIAGIATRAFRRAQAHLETGLYVPGVERDLQAGAAELAEVAGWLLHDAGDETSSRRLDHEALLLARLAGDRSIEHLTLANLSLQALFQRRPGEALQIARSQLEAGTLSPRLRVIFAIREARALAQLGDEAEARRALGAASSAFLDGPSRLDPSWSWWVDAGEFALHRGLALADLGDRAGSLSLLQSAVEDCPPHRRNARFIYLAQLLHALIDAGAWQDAEAIAAEAVDLGASVGSARTHGLLRAAAARIALSAAPGTLREAAELLTRGPAS